MELDSIRNRNRNPAKETEQVREDETEVIERHQSSNSLSKSSKLELAASSINQLMSSVEPPKDRFKLVFLVMIINGIGNLMPWNMLITAKSYFEDYKFNRNCTQGEYNFAENFLPVIGLASKIPNVVFTWLNLCITFSGNLETRIKCALIVQMCLFLTTTILALVDTCSITAIFYSVTIFLVILMNMTNGIYENSMFGVATKLDYAGAIILGDNICGTFVSIISIVSIAVTPEKRKSAVYYFLTALLTLVVCFDTFFFLPLNRFYRYHVHLEGQESNKQAIGLSVSVLGHATKKKLLILKKCYPQCINVSMVFLVTLMVFPTVVSDIKRSDKDFVIREKYFTPVLCFLTFNFFAMIGNAIPSWFQWPSPKYLWIPIILRFLFIPFFLFCRYTPLNSVRTWPVLITNDWCFWFGNILFGLTSGYFSSLSMIYLPKYVESEDAHVAGMFGAAFITTNIFVGIALSATMKYIISA